MTRSNVERIVCAVVIICDVDHNFMNTLVGGDGTPHLMDF